MIGVNKPALTRFKCLLLELPMNIRLSLYMKVVNSCNSSRHGPPSSTAPSAIPTSSVNFTEIRLVGQYDGLIKAHLTPSQMLRRVMLNLDGVLLLSITLASSCTMSLNSRLDASQSLMAHKCKQLSFLWCSSKSSNRMGRGITMRAQWGVPMGYVTTRPCYCIACHVHHAIKNDSTWQQNQPSSGLTVDSSW